MTRYSANGMLNLLDVVANRLSEETDIGLQEDRPRTRRSSSLRKSKFSVMYRAADVPKGDPLSVLVFCKRCNFTRTDYCPTFMHDGGKCIVRPMVCYGCGGGSSKDSMDSTQEKGKRITPFLWPLSRTLVCMRDKEMKASYLSRYPNEPGA